MEKAVFHGVCEDIIRQIRLERNELMSRLFKLRDSRLHRPQDGRMQRIIWIFKDETEPQLLSSRTKACKGTCLACVRNPAASRLQTVNPIDIRRYADTPCDIPQLVRVQAPPKDVVMAVARHERLRDSSVAASWSRKETKPIVLRTFFTLKLSLRLTGNPCRGPRGLLCGFEEGLCKTAGKLLGDCGAFTEGGCDFCGGHGSIGELLYELDHVVMLCDIHLALVEDATFGWNDGVALHFCHLSSNNNVASVCVRPTWVPPPFLSCTYRQSTSGCAFADNTPSTQVAVCKPGEVRPLIIDPTDVCNIGAGNQKVLIMIWAVWPLLAAIVTDKTARVQFGHMLLGAIGISDSLVNSSDNL
ncbi:hypothetical protein KC326_g6 [Hortaea werneckii]|nr:hypothetical protein KC326_g6 [Hortaea werneckii]